MRDIASARAVARVGIADDNALVFPEALERYRGRLLVACSGGADSVCLAHGVLVRAREEGSEMPHLVYVDHGLRPDSGQEGRDVLALATAFGGQGHVASVELDAGASLEAEARRVRYLALARLAEELEVSWVLLGHTASDQAETVFMRILRGTGLVGLAGMPAERGLYARPLLPWRRRDTEAYCQERGLRFVEDPMNRELRFTRARIRHRWLPELRNENAQIDEALCRLAHSARDHREVLDWAAERVLCELLDGVGRLSLSETWKSLPESLAIQVLAKQAACSGIEGLEARHLRAIFDFASDPTSGTRHLSLPGARLCRSYDELYYESGVAAEGEAIPAEFAGKAGYAVRAWQAGDRMRPLRLKGHSKKLSDIFGDAKIPVEKRQAAKVVIRLEDAEIVWVEHVGLAFDTKIHDPLKRE